MLLECIDTLQENGVKNIICASIHGIFADGIDAALLESGLQQLVTSNTILHLSNKLDVTQLLIPPIKECLQLERGKNF